MYQSQPLSDFAPADSGRSINLAGLAQAVKSCRRAVAREKSKTFRVASRNQKSLYGAKWLLAQARADWQVATRTAA
jgi:hypothetical protein